MGNVGLTFSESILREEYLDLKGRDEKDNKEK
jgi:hypothetical protein